MSNGEAKGLSKPVKLKAELAAMLGAKELPRTEITKKLWDYIKAKKLQSKTENGKPTGEGRNIVADATLLALFTKVGEFSKMKEGQTINMMKVASVVSANVE
jgi:chromatin remodeling complex protein RSC6